MYRVKTISKGELELWLKNKKINLIDVRKHNEQVQGVIENSIIIPLHLIPLELPRLRTMKNEIVFYCRTGARSAQACMYMAKNGVTNTYSLEGGIENWLKKD